MLEEENPTIQAWSYNRQSTGDYITKAVTIKMQGQGKKVKMSKSSKNN